MLLDTVNRVLQLGMKEGITTNDLDFSVEYEDKLIEKITPGTVLGAQTGATAQTILGAPAANTARRIKEINICNLDTVVHNVTISIYDSSIPKVFSIHEAQLVPVTSSLSGGYSLHYNEYNGWDIL